MQISTCQLYESIYCAVNTLYPLIRGFPFFRQSSQHLHTCYNLSYLAFFKRKNILLLFHTVAKIFKKTESQENFQVSNIFKHTQPFNLQS